MADARERTAARSGAQARGTVRAAVDGGGRFVGGDGSAFARLGLDPDRDAVRAPSHGRTAWGVSAADGLHRIAPGPGGGWTVDVFPDEVAPGGRSALSAENLATFARTVDFGETIKNLSAGFAAASGMTAPIVVLIDPSGDPTFAGGTTQDSRQLAAMEQCRRSAAPMAIWQAFEEQRLTVDARWIETVMTDDRFVAIRKLLPPLMEQDGLVYVAVPLHGDRAVIGVVAGFWPRSSPITADLVAGWLVVADELALGIRFSALLRRAHVEGAEAERARINDDIHAGLAQSIFALSLEIARATAKGASPQPGDLRVLQSMADELGSDVRGFLSDGRASGAGTNLERRLQELTGELSRQTGALVLTDHRVDWDEYGYDFADYVVRVVTEAFRNIIKHSSATHIAFRSHMLAGSKDVVIEIADDGRNGPRPPTSSAGVGVALIRELSARWQGRVELEVAEQGATLTIRVVPEYQSEWAVAQRILRSGASGD